MAHGFTTSSNGLANVLTNKCRVSAAWTPSSGLAQPPIAEFDAIWDTGATHSVISQTVVDKCGLAPTGMTKVHGVSGVSDAETYLVNIRLPNEVVFTGVRATKGILTGGFEILIGMNIINMGDFAVTNLGGKTKFSFSVPSERSIDFVEEINEANATASSQNRAARRRAAKGK